MKHLLFLFFFYYPRILFFFRFPLCYTITRVIYIHLHVYYRKVEKKGKLKFEMDIYKQQVLYTFNNVEMKILLFFFSTRVKS